MNNLLRKNQGFTLVELLVSIAVFSIVVSMAAGGMVRAFRMQNQIVALISVNSNSSLSIEQMAREIRTGFDFTTSMDTSTFMDSLTFTNANSERVTYDSADVEGRRALQRTVDNEVGEIITADNIHIEHLLFELREEPGWPPRITVSLGILPREIGVDSSITNIQTTISARLVDG